MGCAATVSRRARGALAFLDLIVYALRCDLTRVITFMAGNAVSQIIYEHVATAGHHQRSHHGNDPAAIAELVRIEAWEIEQLAYLFDRMKRVEVAPGQSLLDVSAVYFGSDVSNGDTHDFDGMPVIVAGRLGGEIRSGRHVVADAKTPLANLHLALAQAYGVSAASFGNSTASLALD